MNEPLIPKRTGRDVVVSGEFSVIDVGDGLKVEVHRGVYGHERKHGCNVGHNPPLDTAF